MICRENWGLILLISYVLLAQEVGAKSGNLWLRRRNGSVHQVSSKNCSGIFFKTPATDYECACVTGVWGFYERFCGEPMFFLGGNDYCFALDSYKKLAQAALIGNFRDPFEPSISHFQTENFVQLTISIAENEYHEHNRLELDALGSWITVTNMNWTLFGDGGGSICLKPTVPGRRVICSYNKRILNKLESLKWNYIVHVQKGCHSNVTVKADACFPIRRPTNKSQCKVPPILTPCPDPKDKGDTNPPDPFCEDKEINTTIITSTTQRPESTTTPKPLCGAITRETVKNYWLDPFQNQCAQSLNEAIFTDQLRRFAAIQINDLVNSRVQSLDQMKQLVIHSRDIIKKTCIDDFVPGEFFDVAAEAFIMFINEDFFYGVEGIDQLSFDRILSTFRKCMKRATGFIYESQPMGCDLNQITGSLILPDKKIQVTIPDYAKSKNFEPLIETTWKMFLNAHSYCFEDFQIPNDHHHFSVRFLELFSKTIYEKWISPLTNKELYRFILPKYDVLKGIMENLDYCVAATGEISLCPIWMTRSNPLSKPILDSSAVQNKGDTGDSSTSIRRKKRSTWVHGINQERTSIWSGSAYCVQNMVDPSRLGLASCTEAF